MTRNNISVADLGWPHISLLERMDVQDVEGLLYAHGWICEDQQLHRWSKWHHGRMHMLRLDGSGSGKARRAVMAEVVTMAAHAEVLQVRELLLELFVQKELDHRRELKALQQQMGRKRRPPAYLLEAIYDYRDRRDAAMEHAMDRHYFDPAYIAFVKEVDAKADEVMRRPDVKLEDL